MLLNVKIPCTVEYKSNAQNSDIMNFKETVKWFSDHQHVSSIAIRNLTTFCIFSTSKNSSYPRFISWGFIAFRKRLPTLTASVNSQLPSDTNSQLKPLPNPNRWKKKEEEDEWLWWGLRWQWLIQEKKSTTQLNFWPTPKDGPTVTIKHWCEEHDFEYCSPT